MEGFDKRVIDELKASVKAFCETTEKFLQSTREVHAVFLEIAKIGLEAANIRKEIRKKMNALAEERFSV